MKRVRGVGQDAAWGAAGQVGSGVQVAILSISFITEIFNTQLIFKLYNN